MTDQHPLLTEGNPFFEPPRRRWRRWLVGILVLSVLLAGGAFVMRRHLKRVALKYAHFADQKDEFRKAVPLEVAEVAYDGKMGEGWSDWGWGPHRISTGPAQVGFAGYGGIIFHHEPLHAQYGAVSFRYRAPAEWESFLLVSLNGRNLVKDVFPEVNVDTRHIALLEDGWREVVVDWKELNPTGAAFDTIMIGARRPVDADYVLLDGVVLTKAGETALSFREDTLEVRCNGATHPINPLIYGASSDNWASGQTAKRFGGNPLSRYNWELGAWNTGKDWFFENIKQDHSLFQIVERHAKAQQVLALVVPTLGWVAKDGTSFGFPVSTLGAQPKRDPYKKDAGDGVGVTGKPLVPGPPEQTSISAPPELIERWVGRLVTEGKARGVRGVQMYILDNEPTLWNVTHRDVHPQPLSYDELLDRSTKYARAIRQADPDAVIAGPAEWGWPGYQYSAVDREAGSGRPDRRAHGDVPLVAWYLKQMAEYEKANGVRLLDVLDLHFYPQGEGLYGGGEAVDPKTSELRLRSTRALWDPAYSDESWIGEPIRLIPRMKEWVQKNYPGLKLSIGEWNFGAEGHISGGLATAEALGRFGQQGLDAAFHWGDLKRGTPAYWAFRVFRNFDDAGGRFLDVSLPVVESPDVSLFASRDEQGDKLVLVLINRSAATRIKAKVALKGCRGVTSSRLFSYTGQQLSAGNASIAAARATATLEPYSISVVELTTEGLALPVQN